MGRRRRRRVRPKEMVKLSAEDLQRFRKNARAALRRRGPGFVLEELNNSLRLVVVGATPILGMCLLDWSAYQLLLFLLIGAWVGIICDFFKLGFLRPAIMRYANTRYDDWHVWLVVGSLRAGRESAARSHLDVGYQPNHGVFVDVVMGGMASVIIYLIMRNTLPDFELGVLAENGAGYGLLFVIAIQIAATAWEIIDHRLGGGRDRPVRVAVGLRGVGLFLLMFVLVIVQDHIGENAKSAQWTLLTINGVIVAYGVMTAIGLLFLGGETRWLREYLSPARK